MRNFISDVFMGAMDGVPGSEYRLWLGKMLSRKIDISDMDVAGHTYPMNKIYQSYKDNAASGGFFQNDVGRGANFARSFSEGREDFGRVVHYSHALKQEYGILIRKGVPKEKAFRQAEMAATFRVNKYHFDYGALTNIEQKVLRRIIPFYTYMRKAIPALVEAIYLGPRNLVYTQRLFNSMNGTDDFDGVQYPDYLRESLGFMGLTGGEEPWGLTTTALPTNVFDISNNPVSALTPLIQAPFEMQFKKDVFTGQRVETWADLFTSNMRIASTVTKVKNKDIDVGERIASVLGIPLIKVTKEDQEKQLEQDRKELNKRVKDIDKTIKLSGMHIYINNKNQIKVKDLLTGEITTYGTIEEALTALLPYENREVRKNNED